MKEKNKIIEAYLDTKVDENVVKERVLNDW